jgi:hypothetical protein
MPANHRLLGRETGEGGVCSKLRAGVMRVRGSDDPMSQRSHIEDLILRLVSSSEARGNQPWNGSVSPPKIRTAQTSTRWEKAWGKFRAAVSLADRILRREDRGRFAGRASVRMIHALPFSGRADANKGLAKKNLVRVFRFLAQRHRRPRFRDDRG